MYLPAPGVTAEAAAAALREHAQGLRTANQHGGSDERVSVATQWRQYHLAVQRALVQLRVLIGRDAADELLLTPSHRDLLASTPGAVGAWANPPMPESHALGFALMAQIEDRSLALTAAADELTEAVGAYGGGVDQPRHLVVADTNVYLNWWKLDPTETSTPRPLAELDWRQLLLQTDRGISQTIPLVVLVPDLVVAELDRLKDRGHGDVKTRARAVLAELANLFGGPDNYPAASFGERRWNVTARLVFTPTSTSDTSVDVDAALIDLARGYKGFVDDPVHFVTGDLAASFRARQYADPTDPTLTVHYLRWPTPQ